MHSSQTDFANSGSEVTDKIVHHGYHRFYPWFLRQFRGQRVRFLEIGLDHLGSVTLWRRYFGEELVLHGIDRDKKQSDDHNVFFHKLDQSNAAELRQFVSSVGTNFDVILDDGSHIPEHQLLSLEILWSLLSPGGFYILEDTETSYWGKSELYGYEFDSRVPSSNLIHQFRAAIDAVNFEFLPEQLKYKLQGHPLKAVLADIEMVSFGQNCIILLKKDATSFGQFYDREYLLKNKMMPESRISSAWRRFRRDGMASFLRHIVRRLFGA